YTFHLRRDAQFSNGRRVVASDIKYSFQRVLDPDIASPSTWVVERIREIQIVDDWTVLLRLDAPFAPFLGLLAMPAASIVPREEIERCEKNGVPFGEQPVGSGPWLFREWRHDQYLLFERSESYWDRKPHLQKVIIQIVSSPFTAIAEFETGRLAAINPLPIVEIPRWRSHPQWKAFTRRAAVLNVDMILLNCERPPLDRAEVRRALCQAVDAPLLLEAIREGAGEISAGPVPPGLDGHTAGRPMREDAGRLRSLLSEAGLMDRGVDLIMPSRENFTRTTGEVIQAVWKEIGVPVRLRRLEWVTYRQALRDGQFDAAYRGWFADYPDADNFLYPLFHSSQIGSGNMSRFRDAEVDSLIEASQRELDPSKRKPLLEQANRAVYEKSPALILWHESKYIVTQPWLHGYGEPLIFNGTRFLDEAIGADPLNHPT
ncbi:MAG: ABC transporter substrate-binding protein, partial [Candidatus Omnitrophica bacterium]|nr:ABC transporter substrate-binding protein [Candidatus Omnitrophota bacterium]